VKWEITKSLLEKISIMLQLFLITQQIDRIFKSLITAMKYFKHQFILIILSIFFLDAGAQNIQRYKDISFSYPDSILNIPYGSAQNLNGKTEELLLDLYSPGIADTATKRPLMIFIHGGGFQSNTKSGAYPNLICNGLAKRGYMVATINYRLGIPKTKTDNEYAEAMYRAVQDAKAAVRFFRRYADKYRIDPDQIFVMGSSAGAKTAMHLAYLDQEEVPLGVDQNKLGNLEGNNGNPGYSSKVSAVVNCWGAMIDYRWIQKGDAPLFNISGTADKTVPFDSSFNYHGFKYGSAVLYNQALQQGIATGLRLFYGSGHTLDNDKKKQDSALQDLSAWLFTQLKINAPEKPEIFKWEQDISKLEAKDKTEKGNSETVLFIGSSYIRLWDQLSAQMKPLKTINRGFGGSKLQEVAYYLDRLLLAHQDLKGVFLYVGNDIVGNNLDKTALQDLEMVKYITLKIRAKYPTIPIFWNQISPSEKRWAVWDRISEANELIKTYCSQHPNLYYVETATSYLGKDGKPISILFREDKLHYNDAGYVIWANYVKQAFKQVYGK
jgi:dienelactone hydrolase/lysophospholipase L1-like esterase